MELKKLLRKNYEKRWPKKTNLNWMSEQIVKMEEKPKAGEKNHRNLTGKNQYFNHIYKESEMETATSQNNTSALSACSRFHN